MATLPQQHKEVETGGQEEILQEIVRISELDTNNPDVVILSGLKLHNLATQAASDNLGDYLVQSLGLERIKRLQDFSLFFEITLDNAFMEGVLSGKFSDPDQHPLQPVYNLLAKREYDLVMNHAQNISRKPWIHIGSGYPETAIGIYKQFGIPIICVDKNKRVVQKAEPVLKKFNLWGRNKLTVVNDNGRDILPDGEVVIISSMVPNKDKEVIIENIRRLAYGERGEPLLILRIPASPAFSILYPALFDEDNITKWALRKAGDSKPELTAKEWLRSILFEVIEMADVRRGFDRIPLETASKLHPLMVK